MGDLIYRLLLLLNSSKDEDLNYTIATTILYNIKKIPNMSINKLADLCYTSPAAITRFCHKIGYSNLSEFRESIKFNVALYSDGNLKPKAMQMNYSRDKILENMSIEINKQIEDFKNFIDLKIIDIVIELIYATNNVYIFGTQYSQLMAQELQRRLASVGKLTKHAIDVQDQERLAENLDKTSLVILISPTGRFTLYHDKLWQKIKKSKATVVIISEYTGSEYKQNSSYIIQLPKNDNASMYTHPHMYELNYLIEYIYIRYGSLYSL